MQQTIECSNDACNCTISAEIETESYCNDSCRESGEDARVESETCSCGHPPCDAPD